jgi:large subunit ribosomal protein L24
MPGKVHVKKGDTVMVISGKDESKKGKVLAVFPDSNKVIVEGVNIVKKHKKPRSAAQQGGIIRQEAPIDSSNVMLVCPRCGKPARIGKKVLDDGQKARICKKCGEVVDIVKEAREEAEKKPAEENEE